MVPSEPRLGVWYSQKTYSESGSQDARGFVGGTDHNRCDSCLPIVAVRDNPKPRYNPALEADADFPQQQNQRELDASC